MALKYELKYDDIVGVEHHFELFDDNYTGSPIEVYGRITLDYGQVKENLEAIRGQGLRVDLEADVDLTFEELFEENEKTFLCTYKRDSQILFRGWLNPEGFFEDYVNDKWSVSFDCIDGLGYLKDLAFVDSNGFNFFGLKSQLEVLSLALQRTGINQNIKVSINIFYDTLSDTDSVLQNVFANVARYIKDDDFTVMNCEEVIRDVLEPYGAVLVSYQGEWLIYKPNELFLNNSLSFFTYDYQGNFISDGNTIDFSFSLGSNLDGFYPHYCNGNQRFTNKPSVGAYRISYKYGLLRDVMVNPFLFTSDGQTYEGYNIIDSSFLDIPAANSNGIGVLISNQGFSQDLISTIGISVALGDVFDYTVDVSTDSLYQSSAKVSIRISNGVETYTANQNNSWNLVQTTNLYGIGTFFQRGGGRKREVIRLAPTPIAGDISLVITEAEGSATNTYMYFHELSIRPLSENINSNIKGETFTFQRTEKPSARVEKTKQVFTGDSGLDVYTGTLYKSDKDTPTSTWYRKGITEAVPILELMGAETMRMNANTMRIFSGDVFGYFNYLSVVELDQRAGKYGVTKYSYDTYNNVISMEIKQMYGTVLTDLSVETVIETDNVVEPTIRG